MTRNELSDRLLQIRCELTLVRNELGQLGADLRPLAELKAKRAALELYELHELVTEGDCQPWDETIVVHPIDPEAFLLDIAEELKCQVEGDGPPGGGPEG